MARELPILFSKPMLEALIDGRKTQTRRTGDKQRWFPGDRLWVKDRLFQRKSETSVWLKVKTVSREPLQDIHPDEILLEGFATYTEFMAYWDKLNAKRGYPSKDNPMVWVIHFEIEDAS